MTSPKQNDDKKTMSWSCWWLLPLKAKWWKEDDVMIILVTRSTSLGWSDSWISQPPWVSDQGWSRQQEWGVLIEEQLDLKYERYAALLKLYPWGIANELKQLIRLSVTAFDFLGLFRQPLVLSGPVLRVYWVTLFDHVDESVLLWYQTGSWSPN